MERTDAFEAERPRLVGIASRLLNDPAEAQDVVQQAWLRLHGTDAEIESLPAWLTTVTTRLCLDRLRGRTPVPVEEVETEGVAGDPADDVVLADTVGLALHVVLERLSPKERVAFVLHDSFGFGFPTIAAILDTTPPAARQLASRARAKVSRPVPENRLTDWEVVDAFMAAARDGDFERLLHLLAPDVVVNADEAAIQVGTPRRIEGRGDVAAFFNGSAHAALPVYVGERPGHAWFDRGEARVVFDFTVRDGVVRAITFRAAADALARVQRRKGDRCADDCGNRRHTFPVPNVNRVDPHPEGDTMKTMTCRELGGPCDFEHRGETADDVINAQDKHLKEAEKSGDATHQEARNAMKSRWRHPKKSLGWYRDMQAAFAALPES